MLGMFRWRALSEGGRLGTVGSCCSAFRKASRPGRQSTDISNPLFIKIRLRSRWCRSLYPLLRGPYDLPFRDLPAFDVGVGSFVPKPTAYRRLLHACEDCVMTD